MASETRTNALAHGPRVTRCRTVEYTDELGQTWPAVVTVAHSDGAVNLAVFDDRLEKVVFRHSVAFDQERERDSWRWPERT